MKKNSQGFLLVELLVVLVLMGVVVTSVYGLYTNTRRTASTTEAVADVQQNLRFALDRMSHDIRLAGFLVPLAAGSKISAATANSVSFLTTSTTGSIGVVTGAPTVSSSQYTFPLSQASMADIFVGPGGSVTNRWARVVKPGNGMVPSGTTLVPVVGASGGATPNVVLDLTGVPVVGSNFGAGDVILPFVATSSAAPALVQTVTYQLVPYSTPTDPNLRILQRQSTTEGNVNIADNVTGLNLSYIMDNGTEITSPTATTLPSTNYGDIVAVRITLTGATDATKTGRANFSGVKTRSLMTLVKLRN